MLGDLTTAVGDSPDAKKVAEDMRTELAEYATADADRRLELTDKMQEQLAHLQKFIACEWAAL